MKLAPLQVVISKRSMKREVKLLYGKRETVWEKQRVRGRGRERDRKRVIENERVKYVYIHMFA